MTTAQPAKLAQRILQRAQRVDVEIVGRLVEQQQVAAALQQLGEVDPVAFAARELADVLLLVGAAEVELGQVGARVDLLALAELDDVLAAGRSPAQTVLVGVERVARLVDVGELDGLADAERRPRPGVSRPAIIRNRVVLPAPLGPMTPTMPPGGRENDRSSISRRSP